jgi:hypothetical protein
MKNPHGFISFNTIKSGKSNFREDRGNNLRYTVRIVWKLTA